MTIVDFFLWYITLVLGSITSTIIMGLLVNRFIVKRILGNEDVQDIVSLIKEGKDHLKELIEQHEH